MMARVSVFKDGLMSCSAPRRNQPVTGIVSSSLTVVLFAVAIHMLLLADHAWPSGPDAMNAAFKECKRCHQVGLGAKHRIGPHLNDIFGRIAGSLSGFRYSRSMRKAGENGLVWSGETLDAFLTDPRSFVPQSRMNIAGVQDSDARASLLALLSQFSSDDPELPMAEPTLTPEEYGLDPGLLTIQGDLEYGAYLASECTTCHQATGADDSIPSIAGWPTDEFVITMHAYKRGLRVHPVMQLVAGRLSDEEIASLAMHFRDIEDIQ